MTIERKVGMGIAGQPSGGAADVAEVFSTHLYTGNGNSNIVHNNGIDLAGEGGMVWYRRRDASENNNIEDTVRGLDKVIYTDVTNAQADPSAYGLQAFNSNGFTSGYDTSGGKYVSWTFRKKKKFFDIVTYTGNGSSQTISHSLGGEVGMMLIKRTSETGGWAVYHKSIGTGKYLELSANWAQQNSSAHWSNVGSSSFTVGTEHDTNKSGATYVAYLFADNSSDPIEDQMIKCGSVVYSDVSNMIDLPWDTQFILIKSITTADWHIQDTMRGLDHYKFDGSAASFGKKLVPNTTAQEHNGALKFYGNNRKIQMNLPTYANHVYMIIRAPMMVEPEAATEVFAVSTRGSSAATADGVVYHSNFPVDMTLAKNVTYQGGSVALYNRSRGDLSLFTDTNAVESAQGGSKWDSMHGFDVRTLSASTPNMAWMWKKAKGFMDVVCYRGSGNAGNVINGYHTHTIPHSLGVIPELVIIKNRLTNNQSWQVASPVGNGFLSLNEGDPYNSNVSRFRNKHLWSDTTFNVVGAGNVINASGAQYVAQLFATLAGVSKVGTFTGSGSSSQTIDCGFSAGARFIMIKRTDSDGTWFMWDYVRGIASGNEPWLGLNNNNAHTTNTDIIDPHNSGFIVRPTQGNPNNMNNASATYLFYAIA